jgi:hypothetical protein
MAGLEVLEGGALTPQAQPHLVGVRGGVRVGVRVRVRVRFTWCVT